MILKYFNYYYYYLTLFILQTIQNHFSDIINMREYMGKENDWVDCNLFKKNNSSLHLIQSHQVILQLVS